MKEDIIFFRSVYINHPIGNKIDPEWFYVFLPKKEMNKLTQEQWEAFLMHTYENLFNNPDSIRKMRRDFDKYYDEIDKIKMLG